MLSQIKGMASVLTMLLYTAVNANATYNLKFDTINSLSSFQKEDGGSDEDGYTFTVVNPDTSVPAFINFQQLGEVLDPSYKMITFEYKASAPGNPRVLGSMVNLNFVRTSGSVTNILYHQNTYTTDPDGWYRMTFDIANERKSPIGFGKFKTHVLWIHFVGIPVGTRITIRNPQVAEYEYSTSAIAIDEAKTSFIAPEAFNVGLHNGYGHHSRQFVNEAQVPYSNPTMNGRFPILAWNGVEPHVGSSGSVDWDRLESDFKDYWDCGFSLAMPTGNPQANAHCIWDNIGRFVFKDTGLKMFLKPADLTDDEIKYYAGADRLAGWFIRDEPFVFQLHEMRGIVDRVTAIDKNHILYGNIFGWQGGDPTATGARDYEDYVNQYLDQVGIGYLSYDFYPVRQYVESGERFVHPLFFTNLETVSRICKSRGIPFWGFVHSVESNCGVAGTKYPKPSIEEMKIEAFCALAYGAQGMQYFTYGCPYDPEYNYQNSPLDSDGNKTPTWDIVRSVNAEINALSHVFLGARTCWVANTAQTTPEGCRSLTPDMLPEGFNAITTDHPTGLCISRLSNAGAEYLMVVNPDLTATQKVTFDKTVQCHQVTPEGTVTPTSDIYNLAPGEYVILLLDGTPSTTTDATPSVENTDRRLTDSRSLFSEIDLRQDASGAKYIHNMGTENWHSFSLSPITTDGLAITPDQAADNWGAWFNFTIDVKQESDYDIRIKHSVVWDTYRRIASSASGYDYHLDYDPAVNWPGEFAASMLLKIDGEALMPSNQPFYPARPSADDYDGAAYNAMLADHSSWIAAGSGSQPEPLQCALRLWPDGGNNNPSPRVNDKPDYAAVHLTTGLHTVTIHSLCSPWQFYGLLIDPSNQSGIDSITDDTSVEEKEQWFDMRGIPVDPSTATPGLYIRKQGTKVDKIVI